MDKIQKIFEAGAVTILEVLGLWIFLPLFVFLAIAWVIKIRGKVFNLIFILVLVSVCYVFITHGLQTIPTVYYEKVGI